MPSPQRADLDALLQAAVAERDSTAALRLAEQLVHRRGIAALESLLAGPLAQLQGSAAVNWLRAVVFGQELPESLPSLPSPVVASPSLRVVPLQLRERPASPAPAPAALAALRSWLPQGAEFPQAS